MGNEDARGAPGEADADVPRSFERRVRDAIDQLLRELDTLRPTGSRQSSPAGPSRSPRYQLGERIGVGGMAEVFRGWKIGVNGFERPVAIKRILPRLAREDHFVAMFGREADIIARLAHPNIVSVLDFERDSDGQLLLVMEYVDGVDLGTLLERGPLPPSVILFLASEILSGLAYAHHLPSDGGRVLGVVHRDLSPNNILLSWEGAVKIADFGLAKFRDARQVSASHDVQGKIGFMSPEQINGEPLDGRSDLFSVGVMLWEMLTHERLFADAQLTTAIRRVLDRPIPRPSTRQPVPADLEAVVMKLLRRNRSRRYRNADDAVDALARCDGASSLRARAELVQIMAERFPQQAALRKTRRPPLPHPPTRTVPPDQRPRAARARRQRIRTIAMVSVALALAATAGLGVTCARSGREGAKSGPVPQHQ